MSLAIKSISESSSLIPLSPLVFWSVVTWGYLTLSVPSKKDYIKIKNVAWVYVDSFMQLYCRYLSIFIKHHCLLRVTFPSIWECVTYVGFVEAVGLWRRKLFFGACLEAASFGDFVMSRGGLNVIWESSDVAGDDFFWDLWLRNVAVESWSLLVYVSIAVGCVVIGDNILTSTFSPTR